MNAGWVKGKTKHNNLEITYVTYPVNHFYTAYAEIAIHLRTFEYNKRIELSNHYIIRYQAENKIINAAKKWIDNFIENFGG